MVIISIGGGVLVLSNNRNSFPIVDYLESIGENVHFYSDAIDVDILNNMLPEIIISYNYSYIIKKPVIDFMDGNIYNIHISMLPWNRGSDPNFWSFIEDTPKGVTIHSIDVGLDTGDILLQKEVALDENFETFKTTYDSLNWEGFNLLISNWDSIRNGKIVAQKQSGIVSCHRHKDFVEYIKKYSDLGIGFSYERNIAEYKSDIAKCMSRIV